MNENLKQLADTINDSFVNVCNRQPEFEEIRRIIMRMPEDIKLLARQWGWRDTEVTDRLFEWLKEEKNWKK